MRRGRRVFLGLVPPLVLLLSWQGIVWAGLVPPALLPPPGSVAVRVAESAVDRAFLGEAAVTLRRLFAGLAIAFCLGVPLGIAAARSRAADAVLRPLVRILAPVPKVALYPALILLLGFGDGSKIVLVAADALFPILLAVYAGAASVEPKLVWSARAAGTSRLGILLRVILPASGPAIFTGTRIALVVGCIVVFLAEMISSTDGLGTLATRAGRSFRTADMFVPIIAIAAIGLALDGMLGALRSRLLAGFPDG